MNIVFFALVAAAFLVAAVRQVTYSGDAGDGPAPMEALATGMIDTAEAAVTLAIGLIGVMTLFLGLMKVAEAGGLLAIIARLLRPAMVRLFPEVPAEHPAMGAMIMNLSANMMGLGNAATPFGIRAMQELDKLNTNKGEATNAMVLFLAVNTSSVTLLPTGVIALRAATGASDPAAILPTTLFATLCSTAVAIVATRLYQRWSPRSSTPVLPPDDLPDATNAANTAEAAVETENPDTTDASDATTADASAGHAYPGWVSGVALACVAALIPLAILYGPAFSPWIIPGLMVGLLGFGLSRKVRIYEVFVDGAREGFQVAVRIIPYLVAILVAVGMFRASGTMDMLIGPLGTLTGQVGLPAEALPMALLRPLSGSGAYGILASILGEAATGPDTYTGLLVSTLQGSTETTFYVLAVYFGAVRIRRIRHALAAGLTADFAGIVAAVVICVLLFAP